MALNPASSFEEAVFFYQLSKQNNKTLIILFAQVPQKFFFLDTKQKMMTSYNPKQIFIDPEVIDLSVTKRVLEKFPNIEPTIVKDRKELKIPYDHTKAKKQLYLSKHKGQVVKTCQGMGDYVCCQYFTVALISDCHLECTYCILQDYLKNNPLITINANIEEILAEVENHLKKNPDRLYRVGTGELSDSLALDHITGFSKDLHKFCLEHENIIIELKTKTNNIDTLLTLEPHKRLVISWSVNPQSYIQKEEHKCASLAKRLEAARKIADHGFPVAFHLDPLLYLENWEEEYNNLITKIGQMFSPEEISWISVGSLRFTPGLKKIVDERFPKSQLMTGELFPTSDGKTRYFRPIREEMYKTVTKMISEKVQKTPFYLCMETKTVWRRVFGETPNNNTHLEGYLTSNWQQNSPEKPGWLV